MRWISCEECDGSGVIVFGVTIYEHGCGFPHDSSDERPCEKCDGIGRVRDYSHERPTPPPPDDDIKF